ncbi:hypothetical protein L2E82_27522 [Cichorium intybus]|uniref:Uncharacterized protein n=1 Tax=Cichorium intybus TaxID=13427 RepID=A0ACB9CTL0_CICIN|nr:hypothetical protein L2E82_27522 [Cichorium intybus]
MVEKKNGARTIESTEATSSSEQDSSKSTSLSSGDSPLSSTEVTSSSEGDSSMSSSEGYSRIKRQKVTSKQNQTENRQSSQSRKPRTTPSQNARGHKQQPPMPAGRGGIPSVEEILNLKKSCVPSPRTVSSSESCIICVQGYKVKNSIASIIEAIFMKHGDIAAECVFKTDCVRASFLELVCEVVRQLQTSDDLTIISKMDEIENKVSEAEVANIHVSWLRSHLDAFQKKREAMEKSSLLLLMKSKTSMTKKAAEMDLRERRVELLAAQQQFKKAERCVEVLGIVEKKLNNNILESKTEEVLWARPANVI